MASRRSTRIVEGLAWDRATAPTLCWVHSVPVKRDLVAYTLDVRGGIRVRTVSTHPCFSLIYAGLRFCGDTARTNVESGKVLRHTIVAWNVCYVDVRALWHEFFRVVSGIRTTAFSMRGLMPIDAGYPR